MEPQPWQSRHRGPYQFCVSRPHKTKKNTHTSEWLSGRVQSWDVEEEAHALVNDPRDTIQAVHVWSEKEQQFVMTYRRGTSVAVQGQV